MIQFFQVSSQIYQNNRWATEWVHKVLPNGPRLNKHRWKAFWSHSFTVIPFSGIERKIVNLFHIVSRIAYVRYPVFVCVWFVFLYGICDRSLWFISGQFIISLTIFSLSFHVPCIIFVRSTSQCYWESPIHFVHIHTNGPFERTI